MKGEEDKVPQNNDEFIDHRVVLQDFDDNSKTVSFFLCEYFDLRLLNYIFLNESYCLSICFLKIDLLSFSLVITEIAKFYSFKIVRF